MKAVANTRRFAGREWFYDFRELPNVFDENACQKVHVRLQERYSKLTKDWDLELNSEWLCRLYFSAKLIMGATLNISSALYADAHNLRVVIPYLRYYAVLSLLRSICFTLPEVDWDNGKVISLSHAAATRVALAFIAKFDGDVANSFKLQIRELKAERELLSYRAPSSGDDQVAEKNGFLAMCAMLAEIAQFNSELLEASVKRFSNPDSHQFLSEYMSQIANVDLEGQYFSDKEDAYRLDYLRRKHPFPTNIRFLMTEGHVEDFFGTWCTAEEKEGNFDPDEYQQIIFDIP